MKDEEKGKEGVKEDEPKSDEELEAAPKAEAEAKDAESKSDEDADEAAMEAIEKDIAKLSVDDEVIYDESALSSHQQKDDEIPVEDKDGNKPEEKKAEADDKDGNKTEGEEEEELSNANFARMRIKNTELEGRLDETLKIVEELKSKPAGEQTPQQAVDPAVMVNQVSNAFQTYINASSEEAEREFGTPENARRVAAQAMAAIRNEATVESVQQVIQNAQNGQFGEASEDIGDIAGRELSYVLARERQTQQSQQQEVVQRQQTAEAFRAELDVALDTYEPLKDEKSEEAKFIPVFDKEWLGDLDEKTGKVVSAGKLPERAVAVLNQNPLLHVHMAMLAQQASKSSALQTELDTAKKDLQDLRDKHHLSRAPADPTPNGDTTSKGARTVDDVVNELEAVSNR